MFQDEEGCALCFSGAHTRGLFITNSHVPHFVSAVGNLAQCCVVSIEKAHVHLLNCNTTLLALVIAFPQQQPPKAYSIYSNPPPSLLTSLSSPLPESK